jgi:hypothetical protein
MSGSFRDDGMDRIVQRGVLVVLPSGIVEAAIVGTVLIALPT